MAGRGCIAGFACFFRTFLLCIEISSKEVVQAQPFRPWGSRVRSLNDHTSTQKSDVTVLSEVRDLGLAVIANPS